MTTTVSAVGSSRQVYFHDPSAPPATVIGPSVFVAVRSWGGRLLLVRRCGSDTWEFPGGRVHIGETAAEAAVRRTAEDAAVHVLVTGIVGLFTDPGVVVLGPEHEVQQQFAVLFRARAVGGVPHGDMQRTSDAAWVAQRDLSQLDIEPPITAWIVEALANESLPYIA
jgi:ADP-ribose pyrophosphatase YjhB (NUDIX family)